MPTQVNISHTVMPDNGLLRNVVNCPSPEIEDSRASLNKSNCSQIRMAVYIYIYIYSNQSLRKVVRPAYRQGIPFFFFGKYIQFAGYRNQYVKNIFNALNCTFNARIYFLIHRLIQSTHGKYFQCIGWHNQRVKVFFNALTVKINARIYFLMRRFIQSTRGKYLQCINWHNQYVEVFFNELIVTFNE